MRTRLTTATSLLLLFPLAYIGQADEVESVSGGVLAEFPFETYRGIPRIPVSFHGVDYNFTIDTASHFTCFDLRLLSLLEQTPRRARLLELHATRVVRLYRSPDVSMGLIHLPSLSTVCCVRLSGGPHDTWRTDGLLGMDALHRFAIRVDYDRGVVAFLRSAPTNAGVRATLDMNVGEAGLIGIQGSIGGLRRTFIVDSGCKSYGSGLLAHRDFEDLLARGHLSIAETVPILSDEGSSFHRAGILNAPISIAGFDHTGLAFADDMVRTRSQNSVLGIGYLRRYVLTFDFPNSVVYLAPSAQFTKIDATHDPGGMMLKRLGKQLVVSDVAPRAARKAGVKVNDILEAIDGAHIAHLDDVSIARLLSAGDRVVLMRFRSPNNDRVTTFEYDHQAERRRVMAKINRRGEGTKGTKAGQN
jgi:hypothetical protein